MKRMVTVDDLTGNVIGEWMGGDEQTLDPVPGRTHLEAAPDSRSYAGQRWNGTRFEAVVPAPIDPYDAPLAPREQREFLTRIVTKTDRIA
jgi:hypothetical protein